MIIFAVLVAGHASAQRDRTLNLSIQSIGIDEVAAAIERQAGYRVHYDKRQTDTLNVAINVTNATVPVVLETIFSGTPFQFTIAPDRRIYITYERPILSELPPGFFRPDTTPERELAFDLSAYEKKGLEMKLAEHKTHIIGRNTGNPNGTATVAGNVKDGRTGEPLPGASVYIENPLIGITTDQFGYFALTIPKGRHELKIQSVGMKPATRHILLYSAGRLDIELDEDIKPLKEVVVEADGDAHVMGMQMGMEKLDIKTMKQIPLALGETDIMKVVLTLPGVQSVGEGTVGLNVRGGSANQNLILLNDAVVYNPSHLFGFFSTFNPDVLKNVELYKSGIQAEYGGRLSSVLDVHTREGNTREFTGSGGISPITGRVSLEGPIIRDKTSFIIGARSTYSGWLLRQLDRKEFRNSTASFYDVSTHVTHKINDNNNLYLSVYRSQDRFRLNGDTTYRYSDQNGSIKWKHIFNNKLYGVLTGGYSRYNYAIDSDVLEAMAFRMDFQIQQINARADFSFFPNSRHSLNAGIHAVRYTLDPGKFMPSGSESLVAADVVPREQGLETAAYVSETFELTQNISLYGGLRFSWFQSLGPRDVYRYEPGTPVQSSNITDTVRYASGKSIASYHGAEPRLSLRYAISNKASIKIGYNRMIQYIQMLSNTAAINPTDIWKLSDSHVKPQIGDQYSLGFYHYLKGNTIETSVETYYKSTENLTEYKNGAQLLMNHHIETDLLAAQGKAYGVELMIKKLTGKLNGWVSYTYSRSFVRADGTQPDEVINNGDWYPSNFDKPHSLNFIGNYRFNRRFNLSLNFIYSTGRPITLPAAKYYIDGAMRVHYTDRNQERIPDYFRTDFSINVEGNHKVQKLAHSSWTFAVYNLLGRSNPYSVYYESKNGQIRAYQLSIFARPIPTITYNFKF